MIRLFSRKFEASKQVEVFLPPKFDPLRSGEWLGEGGIFERRCLSRDPEAEQWTPRRAVSTRWPLLYRKQWIPWTAERRLFQPSPSSSSSYILTRVKIPEIVSRNSILSRTIENRGFHAKLRSKQRSKKSEVKIKLFQPDYVPNLCSLFSQSFYLLI